MPAESPAEYAESDDVRLEPHVREPERHHHVVRVWADCSDSPAGTCNTELANYTASYAIGNIFPELTASATSLEMFQISMSGTTPSVTYAYPSGATLTTAETTAAQAVVPSTQAGVVVTVTYTHTLKFFPSLMTTILHGGAAEVSRARAAPVAAAPGKADLPL